MSEKQYHSEDQINLLGLKNFVYAFLRELFRFVEFTQSVIRKKIMYIIIGALLGLGIGLFYYYNFQQAYKANMTVIFNRLNLRTYGAVLEELNTLIKSGSYNQLAAELQIPETVAKDIRRIEGKNMMNQPLITDTSNKAYQLFRVGIIASKKFPADTVQAGLLNYFRKLPYLQKITEVEKKYLADRIRITETDLAKLDTLKTEVNRFLANSKVSSSVYNNAINPAEIYEQTSQLLSERESAFRQLYIENDPVSLVDGFKLVKAPRSIGLPPLLLILGSIGLFTGFLFGLLTETKNTVLPR